MKKDTSKCMKGDGLTIYELIGHEAQNRDLMNSFYDNLLDRAAEISEVKEEEEIIMFLRIKST